MPAIPARIAATPSPNSSPCWKPAVPPPPVAGGAVGYGLAVLLGDGLAVLLAGALLVGLAAGLPGVPAEAGELAEGLAGDDDGTVGSAPELGEPEHAEIVSEASTVRIPHPTAASLALSLVPAPVARTFMEPPHASGGRRPVAAAVLPKPAPPRETAGQAGRRPRRPQAGPERRRGP
jgi:hypothetical protein